MSLLSKVFPNFGQSYTHPRKSMIEGFEQTVNKTQSNNTPGQVETKTAHLGPPPPPEPESPTERLTQTQRQTPHIPQIPQILLNQLPQVEHHTRLMTCQECIAHILSCPQCEELCGLLFRRLNNSTPQPLDFSLLFAILFVLSGLLIFTMFSNL